MPIPEEKIYTADEFFTLTENSEIRQELLDGEIVALASPSTLHQEIVGGMYAEIRAYIKRNNGSCRPFVSPFDVKLNDYTVVIPDVTVICDPSRIDSKRCNGAPDWVIEVTSSNYKTDYFNKLLLYKNSGVREYWIVDPEQQKVFVYFFEESQNTVQFYGFQDDIPVNIYKDAPVPLVLNIGEIL